MNTSPRAWTRISGSAALLLALPLAGCETSGAGGLGAQVAEVYRKSLSPAAGAQSVAGLANPALPAGAAAQNPLTGTELDGIFKKKPITSSNKPERWPRVAITIKAVTPGVNTMQGQGTLRENDCITFDARLWRSATDSQRFDNMRLCTPAVEALSKGVAYRTLQLFPSYQVPRGENSTASQRTDGPNQPFFMAPQDIKS